MPRCSNSDSTFSVEAEGSTPSDRPMWYPLGPARAAARARFLKNRLSKLTSIFDPILVPTCLHFPSQNPPKSFQKPSPGAINFLIDFWMDFLSILAPTWDPTWGQVGAMLATFPAQDASMTPPRRSKMPSKILWIAQDGPRGLQTCPGALQTSILTDVWSIFGPCLIDF